MCIVINSINIAASDYKWRIEGGSDPSLQRNSKIPLNKCNPKVPKRIMIKIRKRATFARGGRLSINDETITLIPLTLLILLKGLSSLIVLKAPVLLPPIPSKP